MYNEIFTTLFRYPLKKKISITFKIYNSFTISRKKSTDQNYHHTRYVASNLMIRTARLETALKSHNSEQKVKLYRACHLLFAYLIIPCTAQCGLAA